MLSQEEINSLWGITDKVVKPSYISPSTFWRSRVKGVYSSKERPRESEDNRIQRALHQLARTVNLVENGGGQGEKVLSLSWASSDRQSKNTPSSSVIYLNPDIIVNDTTGKRDDFHIDVLTGKALTLSSMKRTMHRTAFTQQAQAAEGPVKNVATHVWQAREIMKARRAVLKDWQGFKPYFNVYDDYQFSSKRDDILERAQEPEQDVESFTQALTWNILNPTSPVSFATQGYQNFLDTLTAHMDSSKVAPSKEYAFSEAVASRILKFFEEQKQSNEEPQGSPSGSDPGSLLDQELFGQDVAPKYESETQRTPLSLSDDSLKANNIFNALEYNQGEDSEVKLREVGLYQFHEGDKSIYDGYVREVRAQIAAMKQVFSFRKTKVDRWVHGKEEGELDEGSLHKLATSNPALWSRKMAISKPNLVIGLLIDESGSMNCDARFSDARKLAITLTESLKDIQGVELAVFGHTGEVDKMDHGCYPPGMPWPNFVREQGMKAIRHGQQLVLREFFATRYTRTPYNLTKVSAIAENLDGYAIEAASKRLRTLYPNADSYLLIHISDGAPSYGMIDHTRKSVDKCIQELGVEVFAIGICDAYSLSTGLRLYGEGRNVVISDVMSSLPILTSFLKKKLAQF